MWLSVVVAVLTGSFLMMRVHDYVAPYAASHRLIMASDADVVLVDPRGGRYVTDVVRGVHGEPLGRPVVMALGMLTPNRLDRLCDLHDVAIFDVGAFGPMGVSCVNWNSKYIAKLRAQMAERGCGRVIQTR